MNRRLLLKNSFASSLMMAGKSIQSPAVNSQAKDASCKRKFSPKFDIFAALSGKTPIDYCK